MKSKFLLLILFPLLSFGQDSLSLMDAIDFALRQNLQIQIARMDHQKNENSNHWSQSGFLPTVDVAGNYSGSVSTATVEFITGDKLEDLEAESQNYGGNLNFNYLLFNGLGRIHTSHLLGKNRELSQLQLELQVEGLVLQVVNAYYNCINQHESREIGKTQMLISQERFMRLKQKQEIGAISSLEVLNAEVDFNTDSLNLMNQEFRYRQALRNLNLLMGLNPENAMVPKSDYLFDEARAYEQLKGLALSNHASVMLAATQIEQAQINKKVNTSRYMPTVSSQFSYGYNGSDNNASQVTHSESLGFTGRLTLAWSLFDGNKRNIALQNAQIAVESSELNLKNAKMKVEKDIADASEQFQNSLLAIRMQERTLNTAQQNFQRSEILYNQGHLTSLQFREAQLNLIRVKSAVNQAKYNATIAQYEIKRLVGELVRKEKK